MALVLAGLALVALLYLPGWWAGAVLRRHATDRPDYPHTGAQIARQLLDHHGLNRVTVELTEQGDHYDPRAKAVRLTTDNFHRRSLTAVTVAAHEVGHAVQDHSGYAPLAWRTRLVGVAQAAEKVGALLMLLIPVLLLLTRHPGGGVASFLAGAAGFVTAALVHLITLPVELDASYRRALPMLDQAGLPRADRRPARRILTACAFTYVAASLSAMLNLWRWVAILRR